MIVLYAYLSSKLIYSIALEFRYTDVVILYASETTQVYKA